MYFIQVTYFEIAMISSILILAMPIETLYFCEGRKIMHQREPRITCTLKRRQGVSIYPQDGTTDLK